jgi:hypothetical protein
VSEYETLKYIAESPASQYGGFAPEIIDAAKWAVTEIGQLRGGKGVKNKELIEIVALSKRVMGAQAETGRDVAAIVAHVRLSGPASLVTLRGLAVIQADILARLNDVDSLYFQLNEYAEAIAGGEETT